MKAIPFLIQTFYYYISDSWQMEKISLFKWRIFCPVFGHLTYKSNHGIPFFSNRIKYSKINIVCGKEKISVQSFNLIYFVRLGSGPLRCPSLTRLPMWESIRTPSHQPPVFYSRDTHHLPLMRWSCRTQTTCMRMWWWWRLVLLSTGGNWGETGHESWAWYIRLQCDIGVSPRLPPPLPSRKVSSLDGT